MSITSDQAFKRLAYFDSWNAWHGGGFTFLWDSEQEDKSLWRSGQRVGVTH